MSNGMLNFMLNNKAEAALRLLEHMEKIDYKNDFLIPKYIQDAIEWID